MLSAQTLHFTFETLGANEEMLPKKGRGIVNQDKLIFDGSSFGIESSGTRMKGGFFFESSLASDPARFRVAILRGLRAWFREFGRFYEFQRVEEVGAAQQIDLVPRDFQISDREVVQGCDTWQRRRTSSMTITWQVVAHEISFSSFLYCPI